MTDIKPTSPGEVLQEEFLIPMNITAYRLAKGVHIPQSRISDIISEKKKNYGRYSCKIFGVLWYNTGILAEHSEPVRS
jgi:hypothetical protein